MLRWLILSGTFTVWMASITMLYAKFGPKEIKEDLPGMAANLDSIFSENTEIHQRWTIKVNLQRLGESTSMTGQFPQVQPFSDTGLNRLSGDGDDDGMREVGRLDVKLTRHVTRLEQLTNLTIIIPPEANMPILQLMGKLHYESRADISMDEGLENFSSSLTSGVGLSVMSIGSRDGRELNVTQEISQNKKQLYLHRDRFVIGLKSAPNLSSMPFERRPGIREGDSWNIAMLDTSLSPGQSAQPRIVSMQARCTGRSWMMYGGSKINVYDVECRDGTARAWYSRDGTVLKQRYCLMGVLDLLLIREATDAKKNDPNRNRSLNK